MACLVASADSMLSVCSGFDNEAHLDAQSFQEIWKERLTRAVIAHVVHVYSMTGRKNYLVSSRPQMSATLSCRFPVFLDHFCF